jgi:hypothetical protein
LAQFFRPLQTVFSRLEASELSSNPVQRSEEYLTIEELSARLKLEPKTIRNKMASGIFRKGMHYFSPAGLGPRFKWSAVVAWIEGNDNQQESGIPMRRGYDLNLATLELWNNDKEI